MAAYNRQVTLKGLSGNSYTFNLYQYMPFDFGSAYIYVVGVLDGGLSFTHLYVGKTTDLKNRFIDHHKDLALRGHWANAIGIISVDPKYLDLIEEDLIKGLQPKLNEKLKGPKVYR